VGILGKRGHRVTVARDGRVAVDTAARGHFDLILMDMHMPEMDGLEATRRIRALPSSAAQVPIVALTAAAFREHRQACMDAGMIDVLNKPFQPEHLISVVERFASNANNAVSLPAVPPPSESAPPLLADPVGMLDQQLFSSLRAQLGDEAVEGIVGEYESSSANLLTLLGDPSLDAKNRREAAHSLKGASGVLGLSRLHSLCQGIELALRDGLTERADGLIIALPDLVTEGVALMRGLLESTKD